LKKLREEVSSLKIKLRSIEERIDSLKDECCVICADDFKNPTIVDCCKNIFCFNCLFEASGKYSKCPYCRATITPKDFHVIMDEKTDTTTKLESKEKQLIEMSKTQVLEHLLQHIYKTEPNARILLFSNYSETFKQVTEITTKLQLKYAVLAGTAARVDNIITEYTNGKVNMLMMDAEHYGSGLNLQIIDWMRTWKRKSLVEGIGSAGKHRLRLSTCVILKNWMDLL
jgi:SNF2 family DNA or RNA helicase